MTPQEATCHIAGTLLDYFVVCNELLAYVVSCKVVPDAPLWPHSPFSLVMRSLLRQHWMQTIQTAKPFPTKLAKLEEGELRPEPREAEFVWEIGVPPENCEEALANWLEQAELQLADLHGLDGDSFYRHLGRGEGVQMKFMQLKPGERKMALATSQKTRDWGELLAACQQARSYGRQGGAHAKSKQIAACQRISETKADVKGAARDLALLEPEPETEPAAQQAASWPATLASAGAFPKIPRGKLTSRNQGIKKARRKIDELVAREAVRSKIDGIVAAHLAEELEKQTGQPSQGQTEGGKSQLEEKRAPRAEQANPDDDRPPGSVGPAARWTQAPGSSNAAPRWIRTTQPLPEARPSEPAAEGNHFLNCIPEIAEHAGRCGTTPAPGEAGARPPTPLGSTNLGGTASLEETKGPQDQRRETRGSDRANNAPASGAVAGESPPKKRQGAPLSSLHEGSLGWGPARESPRSGGVTANTTPKGVPSSDPRDAASMGTPPRASPCVFSPFESDEDETPEIPPESEEEPLEEPTLEEEPGPPDPDLAIADVARIFAKPPHAEQDILVSKFRRHTQKLREADAVAQAKSWKSAWSQPMLMMAPHQIKRHEPRELRRGGLRARCSTVIVNRNVRPHRTT